uniref:Uncharacterized protein n=1 Tax=Xenopus tropicalis TaxID=8364 RepID=A0A803J9B5_XENTR
FASKGKKNHLAYLLHSEPKIPAPMCYEGDPEVCCRVLNQCLIQFELKCPFTSLKVPLSAHAVYGRPVSPGLLTSSTVLLQLRVGWLHSEEISFFIIKCPATSLILSLP